MSYKNFNLAVYCPVGNLNAIKDIESFKEKFSFLEKHLKIDKFYLETFRSFETIDKDKMLKIKEFFNSKGIKTSGGITTAADERTGGFDSLCYTRESDRNKLKEIAEFTAKIFDEIILDDFYFTNCKCESCIEAKGDRSWSEFRTELMKEVSENLIIKPAKAVNPKINLIIKYPNWYEHYQETGYNLADEPHQFDMIYTGTETRDSQYAQQHLPRYLSYFIMRYLENVKPGKNGGGWFDPFECSYNLNSYVEQARLTLFSKAREVTLFCLGALLDEDSSMFAPLAGNTFDAMDKYLSSLGKPVGAATYIPYHSSGEDFLHNYIGMLGIPLEPYPEFPSESKTIFLTENAAKDTKLINKIHDKLLKGGNVVVTSGLVKVLQGRGFDKLTTVRDAGRKFNVTQYAISDEGVSFKHTVTSDKPVLVPKLEFCTNDIWELVAGMGVQNNLPILLRTAYGKGNLFILTIPDDFGAMYHYPKEVLKTIREAITADIPVMLDSESNVGLFTYDNDSFIVESFLPHSQNINVIVKTPDAVLIDLARNIEIKGRTEKNRTIFSIEIHPLGCKFFKLI
ncbi:hypothetical protein [Clostridium oryzae]|nr:hypothetical protein [Clostridium oryzae]